ncbi:hypothetical protein Tco_0320922 [Tanacetum coccineum]
MWFSPTTLGGGYLRLEDRWRGYETDELEAVHFGSSMDWEPVNLPYMLAHYLFRHAEGRKRGAQMTGGHFIRCLADHFGLLTEKRLQGTTMVVRELTEIDMDELARLPREDVEGAHAKVEGDQAIPAPVQVPQAPPAAAQTRTMPQRVARLGEENTEIGLHGFLISGTGPRWKEIDNVGGVSII